MATHRIRAVAICAAVCAITFSCLPTGVLKTIQDKSAMDSVKTVGIGPYEFHEADQSIVDSLYAALDTTLMNGLGSSGRFTRITPWDSLRVGLNLFAEPLNQVLYEKARREHLDAILYCGVKVVDWSYMFMPIHDAVVTLCVVDVRTQSPVVTIVYDTKKAGGSFPFIGRPAVTAAAVRKALTILLDAHE